MNCIKIDIRIKATMNHPTKYFYDDVIILTWSSMANIIVKSKIKKKLISGKAFYSQAVLDSYGFLKMR